MSAILTRTARAYASDSAFTAGILLAIGVLGSTASLWLRLG
jgi:hypothetical protein